MPSAAVLGVAQAYGLNPLEEIARFPGFEIAWPAPKLKPDQCLVLVPTLELMIEHESQLSAHEVEGLEQDTEQEVVTHE